MRRLVALVCMAGAMHGLARAEEKTGPVTIGGVTYESVDPGEPFTPAPVPAQDWQAPKSTHAERAAGLLAYVTSDPGDYKPDRIPQPAEHVSELTAFLTPGEYEPVWFGVQGLADVQGLTVRVDAGNAPVTVEVRYMHFWPQRTGWASRRWYITPELLLPCQAGKMQVPTTRGLLEERPFDLKTGATAAFWLTLSAAADAKPGVYKTTVSVQGKDSKALTLPLQIEVLPFKLQRPADRYWTLYCDQSRWKTMSDAQVMAELRDFARHGMNGLVEMPFGKVDLTEIKSGKVQFDASEFKRMAAMCRDAGLHGPHVCCPSGMPEQVSKALGLQCDLGKGDWPEALRAGVAAVAKAAVEATAGEPARWYYYGVDEPAGDNTYAIQDYQAWHAGGARTYATFYDIHFIEKASAYISAPCFVSGLISQEKNSREACAACAKTGAEFWWYGTGSYVNPFPQEGFLYHNRYGAGLLFWKSGATAEATWTFCRPHEDVFNDFDGSRANKQEPKEQNTVYPHFLKADDWSTYQGAIPTIAWEALREGVDDYAYLHTLTQTIAEARRRPDEALRKQAQAAEALLKALVDTVPWANCMNKAAFETRRLQQVRRTVADEIVNLQAALAGQPLRAAKQDKTKVTLSVRTTEPDRAQAESLPVIPVLPAGAPPKVDGVVDDACWKDSAVAREFRYADGSGVPTVPTEARILYDDRALYVAFQCREPAMDKLVAQQQGHDTANVWVDDGVELFVAGAAREPYAHIIVNTNRCVYDELTQDPAWNPAVDVAVQKQADGWSAEIALPWAELEKAGIPRAPVMAVNFCRNRFAVAAANAHSAWSCPFGGFHTPKRFGVALLQEGPVALADLQVPGLWGHQIVQAKLRNLTGAAVTAQAGLGDAPRQTVALPANGSADVFLLLDLLKPGPFATTLAWGVAGQPERKTGIAVTVPEPIAVPQGGGFCSSGDTLERAIGVNVAPADREQYRVRLVVNSDEGAKTLDVPAQPGREKRMTLRLSGRAVLQTSLVDKAGQPVSPVTEDTLVPVRP